MLCCAPEALAKSSGCSAQPPGPRPPSARPQVSLPVAAVGGCPVGLGLIGPRGSDEELLELAERLMAALQQPAGQGS